MHQEGLPAFFVSMPDLVDDQLKETYDGAVCILQPAIELLGQNKWIDEQSIVSGERNVDKIQFWLGLADVEGV